ncbi:MAG TPA: YncE family protein [Telluria sp.]|nr:YncE family protein [Telluria sp.]
MRSRTYSRFGRIAARLVAASALGCCLSPVHAADQRYHVIARQVLEGPVRWDYLSVDSDRHHVFLTRGDHVDVFDTVSKAVVGSIAGTAGVHGVALAPERDRGYTSNGADDSVTVFVLSTLKEVATVKVGAKPDSIVYDARTGRVFVANAKDRSLSVIDAGSDKLVHTIALAGGPETAVVDGKGRLFVALEDKNAIAVIDTATMKVLHQYDVSAECDEPAGLAIDPASARLFAGCHNGKMAIVDGLTGKMLAAPAIGRGNDATAFDPVRKLAFASNGDGTLTIVDGNAPHHVLQTVTTMPRARTMALDPVSHAVFLVAAEASADAPQPGKTRPALKAGTFTLLTIAPQ